MQSNLPPDRATTSRKSSRSRAIRGSPANSQASGASTFTSKSTSLPTWILKQLAEDIERAGGLESLSRRAQGLADLLDYRFTTLAEDQCGYGKRGSDQRKKISNKVQRWKDK
jgi:hypothetical protein